MFQQDSHGYASRITTYPDVALVVSGYGIYAVSAQVSICVIFGIHQ